MNDLKERITEGLHHCGMCGQQAVEVNSRGQWICTACLNEVRPDYMSALRMEAAARIEELEAALADGSFYKEDDIDCLQNRIEELEAKLATARNDALEEVAAINDRWKSYAQDGETFDAAMDRLSRTIRALKSTTQP